MKAKLTNKRTKGEKIIKDIRRATRKQYSAEEKIRIVLDGLRSVESIAELCRQEGIAVIADQKMNLTAFTDAKKERLFWLLMTG